MFCANACGTTKKNASVLRDTHKTFVIF